MLDINPNKQAGQQQAPTPQSWNTDTVPTPQSVPKGHKKSSRIANSMLFIGTLAVFIVLAGAGVWGLVYYKNQEITQVSSDISNTDIQIAKFRNVEQESLALQAQYNNVSDILDKRLIWKQLIDVLSDETLKKAVFVNLSVEENSNNTVSLSGKTDSLTNLAKFIVAFQNSDNFSNIDINSFTAPSEENSEVSFTITLKYKKEIVSPSYQENE